MELVASCHSQDFKTLKALTKVNPSSLLRAQADFCHADPTLPGEELQAPASVCLTIPSYPIFHFSWWLLHSASYWEEPTAGLPLVNPSHFIQYFTHRWYSRERAQRAPPLELGGFSSHQAMQNPFPASVGNIQPEIPGSCLGIMYELVNSANHGTSG